MATATMATAAGAAALLYYTLNKKLQSSPATGDDDENGSEVHNDAALGIDRISNRLIQAPATWLETISTLSETLRFTYSETLGKWPIGDLAFGISFLLKRQILKPAFTVLVDHKTKSFLLLIRGTHSVKDTLTAVTGAVLPFHHTAACMTWELAESGNDFITSVINGADLVPTFSAASVDDLRAEVTASAWLNDLRNQIERTRILSTVYRSASALGSRLPSMATAKAKVAGAGAILRPVSSGTQVVMRRAQSMAQAAWSRPGLQISSWSCMGPRRRPSAAHLSCNVNEDPSESSSTQQDPSEPFLTTVEETRTVTETTDLPVSSSKGRSSDSHTTENSTDSESDYGDHYQDRMTEVELWQELEHELYEETKPEEGDTFKEIREEESEAIAEVSDTQAQSSVPNTNEVHRFFPAGRILHIVSLVSDEPDRESDNNASTSSDLEHSQEEEEKEEEDTKVGIFRTPRSLYSKLRLSQTMIADHFMPVYRRQIEKLIREVENEGISDSHSSEDEIH
ncbi:UNVERIFIED_CONTAM: hypothetical protein Sradi_1029500 [Sesamum radiatum]|uniref:Mono-/di-acylglycerol lipase N-terminal domain-containing protein n=1 Tax=Sesamum radiatum TaxID=300843 RepID=A0AAW2V6S6_SESRA